MIYLVQIYIAFQAYLKAFSHIYEHNRDGANKKTEKIQQKTIGKEVYSGFYHGSATQLKFSHNEIQKR